MVALRRTPYVTRQEYLEQERRAETKSEYHDGVIVAMSGASNSHDRIVVNTLGELYNQLRGTPCEARSSDTRVYVPAYNRYFYPDVLVSCPDAQFEDEDEDTLLNPILIFEALSDSTERTDRRLKADCYRTLPSLAAYVLIAQDEPRVEIFTPQPDGAWHVQVISGLDGIVDLPVIACRLRLRDMYARVRFAPVLATSSNILPEPPPDAAPIPPPEA